MRYVFVDLTSPFFSSLSRHPRTGVTFLPIDFPFSLSILKRPFSPLVDLLEPETLIRLLRPVGAEDTGGVGRRS